CGGTHRIESLQARVLADTALECALRVELDRSIGSSRFSSRALYLRGSLFAMKGDFDRASADFRTGLVEDPLGRRHHEALGIIAAAQGRPEDAIAEYRIEAENFGWMGGLSMRMGDVLHSMGKNREARDWYARELATNPANTAARDSL